MDRSQEQLSVVEELRQIRHEVRLTDSLEKVRREFERVQEIRRGHLDDFDLQIIVAEVHQELIERARVLRGGTPAARGDPPQAEEPLIRPPVSTPLFVEADGKVAAFSKAPPTELGSEETHAAEIPADVPKLDPRSWQLAIGLAVLFTVCICALFFLLIQSARRSNFKAEQTATSAQQQPSNPAKVEPVSLPVPPTPTLRLYTDLIPGTIAFDDAPPQALTDGEWSMDKLAIGTHSVKVVGGDGSAAFTFQVADDKEAPVVSDVPSANNVMAVAVGVANGQGRVIADSTEAKVILDGKEIGETTDDGLALANLGTIDHDLQVVQEHDRQRFVLTYTPAPTLTVYVKSDPSKGVLVVEAGQDGVSVYVDGVVYRRTTEKGQVHIPLKVGRYKIRVHKNGFIDPPVAAVEVKKAEEAEVTFRLQPAPQVATLQVHGAAPGTVLFVDRQIATTVGPDGTAKVMNITAGEHTIELHHEQAAPKKLVRTFDTGETLVLSGDDVVLDKLAADNTSVIPANPGPPALPPPVVPNLQPETSPVVEGEQVRKGGGFVPYHVPKVPGRYSFQAHGRLGGLLKHSKLQWYAGYRDKNNYVLFSLDGKHAEVKEMRDGKQIEWGKVPFNVESNQWVQIDLSVKPGSIDARVKTTDQGWSEVGAVNSSGRDFTQDGVGLYIPANEEVAVANFRFSSH